ncbi:MAG: amino-acid N-acetyltransferase [Spirochaetaceae bacterium]|jgi:amino-acid N-acetyltransferase|nr:amino-acid N-acetyltransferase [Spirochaetaceae bacterium]
MKEAFNPAINVIREAFAYQNRFAGSTMIFKIDFPVTTGTGFSYLMKDIALLVNSGIRVVIVPGCKEWIDTVLLKHNIVSEYSGAERITSDNAIPLVEMAAFHVATRYMTGLSASRVDAVIGNFVRARGRGVIDGVDMKYTGTVDKIFVSSMRRILDSGMAPILPCIGWSPSGKPYNVPSDEIAVSAASALAAVKLFIVTAGDFLKKEQLIIPAHTRTTADGRILRLNPREADEILMLNKYDDQETAAGERADKDRKKCLDMLRLALSASTAGVERVHIINGCEEGALLNELFTNLGVGTMLYADEYEAIRGIRNSDVPDILHIMEPLVCQDILIRRSAEDIQKKKDDYVVYVIDGSVHACGALHDLGDGQAELAALAADKAYSSMNMGRRIVYYLIEKARGLGMRRVLVFTTKTQDWFELLGFRETSIDTLPQQRRESYNYKRMSKIFALDLFGKPAGGS